jgi:predicted CopG family antitoxin
MSTADEQIRVSESVKRELDRRKRPGESYNDVLERLFAADRDLLAGFGRWSDETAERAGDARKRYKQRSKERMERLAEES